MEIEMFESVVGGSGEEREIRCCACGHSPGADSPRDLRLQGTRISVHSSASSLRAGTITYCRPCTVQ